MLLLRQAYLARKLQSGDSSKLAELKSVKILINQWYENENEKVKLQSRILDITNSEKVNIYHHALHHKNIRKTSILKLETDQGLLQGHSACAEFLENSVKDFCTHFRISGPPVWTLKVCLRHMIPKNGCLFGIRINYEPLTKSRMVRYVKNFQGIGTKTFFVFPYIC